jgi:hypothetical protein
VSRDKFDEQVLTINALRGALSVKVLVDRYLMRSKTSLTSLLDDFGTRSLSVVGADDTVETVLDAQLAVFIAARSLIYLPYPC